MPVTLNIGCWNIQGLKSKQYENKFELKDAVNILSQHDIFGVVETHASNNSNLSADKFKHYIKCRNKSGSKNY